MITFDVCSVKSSHSPPWMRNGSVAFLEHDPARLLTPKVCEDALDVRATAATLEMTLSHERVLSRGVCLVVNEVERTTWCGGGYITAFVLTESTLEVIRAADV